jgi:hypothetical protein
MTRRPPVALAALAVLAALAALLAAPAARAADWSFDPSVVAGIQYNDNVFYVTDTQSGNLEPLGDWIGVLSVALPVTATTPRSSTSFSFTPTRYQYDDKTYAGPNTPEGGADLSDLSYTDYTASLGWRFDQSTRTAWEITGSGARSQRQGVSYDNVQQDLFVLPPTTTTSWSASGSGTFRLSERAAWIVRLGSTGTRYNRDLPATPVYTVDNSMTTTFGLASETRLSPKSQLRIGYIGQYIDNSSLGSDLVQNLGGAYIYGNAVEGWEFTARAGAGWLKTVDLPAPETGAQRDAVNEIKPVFQFSASRQVLTRSLVEMGVLQEFTGSNGVEGTALVLGAYAALRVPIRQYSRFGLALRYSDRSPVSDTFPDTETLGASAEYVAGLSQHWALGFGVQYYDQAVNQTPDTTSFVFDGTYAIYSAVVSWNPTAR